MATIKVDLSKCQGYANCVVTSPDAFDLGDDGKVVLLTREVTPTSSPRSKRACGRVRPRR